MSDLVFLLSADVDIQSAFEIYEEKQAGRGELFMRHLEFAFTNLRSFPEMAPIHSGIYRRLLVPKYPYAIFYSIEGGRIIVCGVMNLRQDPEAISKRLEH
jgi:plasmid stabilization system protein ParE